MTYDFATHRKGDTWQPPTFTGNIDGTAINLAGATIAMKVRDCNGAEMLSLTSVSGITITDAVGGVFKIDDQVLDIAAGVYNYDIEFTLSDGNIFTWIVGKLIVSQDQTY